MNMTQAAQKPVILQDLGDGLILRRSVPADADRLAEFNSRIHEDPTVGIWVRDLLLRSHPTFHNDDFTIVEDSRTGKIVSSLNTISQTWAYAGIPFGVGRPELVGTDEAYRYRGLVRKQFEVIHEWSQQRGELVQAITGIPYYYRQFGYEMTLALGGSRSAYESNVPQLKEGEEDPYRIRPAVEADLPFILELDARSRQRSLVNSVWDETTWRYEMFGVSQDNCNGSTVSMIETAAGEAAGVVSTPFLLWDNRFVANYFELKAGLSWYGPTATVLRHLLSAGQALARQKEKSLHSVSLALGNEHPAYEAGRAWLPGKAPAYAFFMRVPDLPAFVMHIAPALEENLRNSIAAGYTGDLKISFYRTGIIMKFEQGRLCDVKTWKPGVNEKVSAAFPDHTFLHLLFGHRSIADLQIIFADCYADDSALPVLNALFPKQNSRVRVIS
jgi:hypothetical protein